MTCDVMSVVPCWTVALSGFGATKTAVTVTPATKAAARASNGFIGAFIGTLFVSDAGFEMST
jgi:hypothetical protein